ncbi:hypothetical protein P3339_09335 [Microbulbifer sp. MLAF003]|uniref:hypothetical protein n=1 Tax=Microbulbifer sp. MLAF003 TaxID=3032582 RepID=UPI0024AE0D69|nr:hypothetical protein [Microbulbifer sp. MLAF003]WHI52944.1 hypothetical protein P3339_09335 [Microbulbifer sp. MLAF003]
MLFSRSRSSRSIYGALAIAFSALVGCSDFFPVERQSPAKEDFLTLTEDDRILYKEGMKDQALLIRNVLDEKVKDIEIVHGKPFINPPVVHLCDTRECFAKYTGIDSGILAAVSSNGLFLKSYVVTHEDYSRWLAHELSHLHLRQQISTFRASFIPQWYQEGLATFASNGGGANKVSRKKALEYIHNGKHIVVVDESSLFSDPWPLNYVVANDDWPKPWYQQHMNYRQASLFYEFLHPNGGIELIRTLENGETFNDAFKSVYGKSPEEMFAIYKSSLAKNKVHENI